MTDELSGRDLELAVGERVFGFRWFRCAAANGVERNQFLSSEQADTWRALNWELTEIQGPRDDQFNDDTAAPRWATSIEAAFQVVEKMRELDQDAEVEIVSSANMWKVSFEADRMDGAGFQQLGFAIDVSLPTAICLAALACMNGNKG